MNLHLLYIDPGTGSALFSILIGAAATIYFLGRALIIKLKVFFSGGKAATAASLEHPFVIYNEGKQYWNVFKPVLDEFENRKTGLLYLTSAQDDPVLILHGILSKLNISARETGLLRVLICSGPESAL